MSAEHRSKCAALHLTGNGDALHMSEKFSSAFRALVPGTLPNLGAMLFFDAVYASGSDFLQSSKR